ncbi:MAG: hypothetical protein HFH08_02545 [Bacilli bacterium]|nr:hypothetical protein [Bacilli bacterium]
MIKQSSSLNFRHQKIRCAKYTQIFARMEKAHFYVIDLTEQETREKVAKTGLLTEEGFQEFSSSILSDIYFKQRGTLQYNLNFVFLIPEGMDITTDMWRIKEDFQYMRKLFLKPSEFSKIILENQKREVYSLTSIGTEKYKIYNFNVVSSTDLASNLELLKLLSDSLKTPIVNIGCCDDSALERIRTSNRKNLTFYYQKLWSMFQEQGVPTEPYSLSSTEQKCLSLASALSVQPKEQALLLDGFGWRALDDSRRLNLIATLSDFSEQSGSVFLTCENKDDISLIKKKVYRANFIVPK